MKVLLFSILLVFCAVKCDDVSNNYYVIEMPEDEMIRDYRQPFLVYWNVPTIQCKSRKVTFNDLYEKYGIIQNDGDQFRGEKITIMYEPGTFPAIFKNETSGKYRFRNGGVPQEGSLDEHLKAFREDLKEIVPDPDFNGVGIIDFESWRPIFRQNFGTLVPYKDVSYEIEKKLHWWWPKSWIHTEATQRFEAAARTFMQNTLSLAKQLRPRARWGYYGFPHCFNMAKQTMKEDCSPNVLAENDLIYWLWSESTALFPSVYSSRNLTTQQLGSLVRGRVREAVRVRRRDTPVLPYFWFSYREGGYMSEDDLNMVLKSFYKSNASGFIIWGSSSDVSSLNKCKSLHTYVETVLGPTIAKYVKQINIANDVIIETPEITINNENLTNSDIIRNVTNVNETVENSTVSKLEMIKPAPDWVPPENYTQDISQKVEEELEKKGYIDDRTDIKTLNDSAVVDMIFDALIKTDSNSTDNNKQTTRNIQDEAKNNTFLVTEAPAIKDLDALNSLITKDPLGFIEKLAQEEERNAHFDDPVSTKESTKVENEGNGVTKAPIDNILLFKENQNLNHIPTAASILLNKDATSDSKKIYTTTSKYEIPKEDNNNLKSNSVKIIKDNFFMDIFDALLKANDNLEAENSKDNFKNEVTNPVEYNEQNNIANNNEPNSLESIKSQENITTEAVFIDTKENYTKLSKIESEKLILEREQTTGNSLFDTTENNITVNSSRTEEDFGEDSIGFNKDVDDFLFLIGNTTDLETESSTQNSDSVTFGDNEDNLIILSVNLSSMNSSQYTSDIKSDDSEYSSTLSDSVTESVSGEFSANKDDGESATEGESDSTTYASDQVVKYIYYP